MPTKVCLVKAMFFSSSHVWMWELDSKESWVLKNWCFWIVVLDKILESPLDCKEIQPVHPKGNQSWISIGRTDAEAETPICWSPDLKNWLIWKDPDAGKDWEQEEKGMIEDEMVGWHYRLNWHESEWGPGVGVGPGNVAYCSPWAPKEWTWLSDWTELNWNVGITDAVFANYSKASINLLFEHPTYYIVPLRDLEEWTSQLYVFTRNKSFFLSGLISFISICISLYLFFFS